MRLRLTLLYGFLFLVSGALLLALALVSVRASGSAAVSPTIVTRAVGEGHHGALVGPGGAEFSGQPNIPAQVPPALRQALINLGHAQSQIHRLGALAVSVHGSDLHRQLIWSVIALALMAVASMVLGWLLAGRVLAPLQAITSAAREISASNLHQRLALEGPDDELRELGDTFDELLGRLESSFEAQRQFVANASHELRTPLARLKTLVQVTLADPRATPEALRAAHERVLASEEQLEQLIDALLDLASSERGPQRREALDVGAIAAEVLAARRAEIEGRGLQLEAALRAAPCAGDPQLLERLVANLLDNAMRHNTTPGRIEIATAILEGGSVLRVANSGPEIPPEELERLQQPFQRLGGDRVHQGAGHGLGLSIVNAIALAHRATVEFRARPEGGLEVEVRFAAEQRPPRQPGRGAGGSAN